MTTMTILPVRGLRSEEQRGFALLFGAYAALALSDACVRALGGGLSPFLIAFAGVTIGLALLPGALGRRMPGRDLFAGSVPLWLARAASSAIASAVSVTAFSHLPMPEAFALIFMFPIFVTLLSMVFLGERIGIWRGSAVVMGFCGVMVVLRPGLRQLDLGHLAALVCALASAISVLLLRVGGGRAGGAASIIGAGLIGTLVLNGALMLPAAQLPTGTQALLLAGYGGLALLGQALLLRASRRIAASRITPAQYSQIIWALMLSYLAFGERVDAASIVGSAIIMASAGLTWLRERLIRQDKPRRILLDRWR